MNYNNEIRSDNSARKGANTIRKNVFVFTFFLLLSFIFWYLNSLGKDIEAEIKYKVRYTSFPANRYLSNELPSRLNLYLKGPGYSILQLRLAGNHTPLVIDISKSGYRKCLDGKTGDYYMVTANFISKLNDQVKPGCKITSVKPDTLFFSLKQAQEKK